MKLTARNIIIIAIFLILQIVWFNNMLIFNKYTPIIFIYPLLTLSFETYKTYTYVIAFLMGLSIDFFLQTGGVFAATSLLIVHLRKYYFLLTKKPSQELTLIKPYHLPAGSKLTYFFVFTLISQLLIYFFESFQFSLLLHKIPLILINTLISVLILFFIDFVVFNHTSK